MSIAVTYDIQVQFLVVGKWQFKMNKITTIKLSKETLERIKKIGNMGESYEDVIKMLLVNYNLDKNVKSKK